MRAVAPQGRQGEKALTVVEGRAGGEQGRVDYHRVRGRALLGLDRPSQAIDDLLQANKIYDSDTSVLNALGASFAKTGMKEQALAAFQASLKIDGGQESVRKAVADLEKDGRK